VDLNDLVTVYSVSDPIKAEIIKNALRSEGIRCFLEGENQGSFGELVAFPIKIQVPASDADKAARFIESHERGHKDSNVLREPPGMSNETPSY
jgi:hypothetical protein